MVPSRLCMRDWRSRARGAMVGISRFAPVSVSYSSETETRGPTEVTSQLRELQSLVLRAHD